MKVFFQGNKIPNIPTRIIKQLKLNQNKYAVWITLLALYILHEKFSKREIEWRMLEVKAL
jgi:hypothetical protein